MPFESRDSQTRIKHEILREYVGAWAGIISAGVRRRLRERPGVLLDLVYLDGFAGYGRYEHDTDQPTSVQRVWGSPILALQALEAAGATHARNGLLIRVTGILVEKEAQIHEELCENLRAGGLTRRIVQADWFDQIALDVVNVLRGDFRDHARQIIDGLGSEAFLMAFVDPYGTTMPMSLLQRLVARPKTDAISLFPVYEVHKNAGSARKPEADRTEQDWNNIQRNTDHFGDERWFDVAVRERLADDGWERSYVELYREMLLAAAPGLLAKNIGLRFSSRDVPGYHLFLTTRDPNGALRMNSILRRAEFRKYWTHWSDRESREQTKRDSRGELELDLNVPYTPLPSVQEPEIVPVEVERGLVDCLRPGGTYTLRSVLSLMANSVYTREEILSALRGLRQRNGVRFDSLRSNESQIVVVLR